MNDRETMIKTLTSQLQTMVELDSSLGVSYIDISKGLDSLELSPKIVNADPVHNNANDKQRTEIDHSSTVKRQKSNPNANRPARVSVASKDIVYTGNPEKVAKIKQVMAEVARCVSCDLGNIRKNPVMSEGCVDADIAFIASAPGREEDNLGRTFQGPAGQLITDILEKGMKVPRESVYLSSIIKCRPQGNREPFENEVSSCIKYLRDEIEIVKPKVIIAVGSVATNILTEQNVSIEQTRGIWYQYNGIPVMPIYHPSFLLRQRRKLGHSNEFVRKTWQDIKQVMARLKTFE